VPPYHNRLFLNATFHGVNTHGDPFDREQIVRLSPEIPADAYAYNEEPHDPDWFNANFSKTDNDHYAYEVWWGFSDGAEARLLGTVTIPTTPPIDTGTLPADATDPPDQTATIHLYSA
jgi:hypothetical protein